MRKSIILKIIGLIAAVFFAVMFIVSISNKGEVYLADTAIDNGDIKKDGDVQYENLTITYEESMDKNIPFILQDAMKLIPPSALQQFILDEWKIAVVSVIEDPDEADDAVVDAQSIYGVTNFTTKTLQVQCDKKQESILVPFLHEFSHYLDAYYGSRYLADDGFYDTKPALYMVSATRGFQALYEQYKGSYVEYEKAGIARNEKNAADYAYAVSDPGEFFACTLKDYLLHPGYLSKDYPDLNALYSGIESGNASLINKYIH